MKNNNKTSLYIEKPWNENQNNIWLASTVSLYRNIEKFKFPGKLEPERKKQIVSLLSKEVIKLLQDRKPSIFNAEDLSTLQKEFLVEHFLSIHNFHQAHSGEAFIIDETGEFLAVLNIQDHLHLQLIDYHGEIEKTWNKLRAIETEIGKQISYAFSQKYGFLTADYTQCGTAFSVAIFLQVPGLVHINKIDDVLEKIADESFLVTGIQGNPTEIIGDVIMVQNNYTLGTTEENIIASMQAFATKIVNEESQARAKMQNEMNGEIKDKVSRAFGILVHSYQIEAIEALNALSLIKLGIDLKWITGLKLEEVNSLFFNCRRAHLLHYYGEKIKQDEILHKRAEYIHQNLHNVRLTV